MRRLIAAAAAAALGLGAGVVGIGLVGVAPAFADNFGTTTAFDSTTALTVPFGTDWVVPLTVSAPTAYRVLDAQDGTVDVTASGVPGSLAPALKLFRGGHVFLSQPSGSTPLAVGTYQLAAAFEPASGSNLDSSQTTKPFSLTITGYAVTASARIVDDPATVTTPVVQVSLADAEYVKATGGHPAGTWQISVASDRGTSVFESEFAQPATGTKPLEVAISPKLLSGRSYTVDAKFTPDTAIAGGLKVTAAKQIDYSTPAAASLSFLSTRVPVAVWVQVLLVIVLLALVGGVIAVGLQVRRARERRPLAAGAQASASASASAESDRLDE